MTYNARKDLQRHHETPEEAADRREAYRTIRRLYTRGVKAAKKESWQDYISAQAQNSSWGLAYKMQTNRLYKTQPWYTMRTPNGHTLTWRETANRLLDVLLLEDDVEGDDGQQTDIRETTKAAPNTPNSRMLDAIDLEIAKEKLRSGTAPGWDNIHPEMILKGWSHLKDKLLILYNACLRYAVFPNKWKKGLIKIIPKAGDRDPTDPKSYRPICLLPTLGKIFERLLLQLLTPTLQQNESQSQYGFKPGRSTEDAITDLFDSVSRERHKLLMGLFIDFEGAFDTLWWPSILEALKHSHCPRNLYKTIRDYFRGRSAKLSDNTNTVHKHITIGCPQGSVLGPKMWNLVMEEVLHIIGAIPYAKPIAYADDLVVLVPGDSRRQLEERCTEALQTINAWSLKQKLKISATKTVGLLLKGRLDEQRPPTIRCMDGRLRVVQEQKYLGITIQANMKMNRHVQEVANRTKDLFWALARLGGANWGYQAVNYELLYKAVYQPIAAYGAHGWARNINQQQKKVLIASQRQVLIRVTKAYATAPTVSLPVVAGVLPIDLYLEKRTLFYKVRKEIPFDLPDAEIEAEVYDDPGGRDIARRHIDDYITEKWQARWDASERGRTTHAFIPNIEERKRMKWLRPTHQMTQLLTGHGALKGKLHQLGLVGNPNCNCYEEEEDTVQHVLYRCTKYCSFRDNLRNAALIADTTWPPNLDFWLKKEPYTALKHFTTRVFNLRETEERRRNLQADGH